jgi:hypothetical protein
MQNSKFKIVGRGWGGGTKFAPNEAVQMHTPFHKSINVLITNKIYNLWQQS